MALKPIFIKAYWSLALMGFLYCAGLALLLIPDIQKHAVYMHKVKITWLSDLVRPEQFGFAKNQVTPFYIDIADGEKIFAWHVLPLGLYTRHREELVGQEYGIPTAPIETKNLQLLKNDPEARLIIHFHGNAGTVGAGYRPTYLRSLSAADPSKIHILTIDYRGFGLSSGVPSEDGLIKDGLAAVRFAVDQLGISSSRIALVGQSLGTGVAFGVAEALATQSPAEEVGAVISIAGFSHMRELVLTYKAAGIFPVLSVFSPYPWLQKRMTDFIIETWNSTARVESLVKHSPNLNLVLIHATNDRDIPNFHCDKLFAHAANAARKTIEGEETAESAKALLDARIITNFGNESTFATWPEEKSNGRQISQWIVSWGGHNAVVTSATTSVVVAKAFGL